MPDHRPKFPEVVINVIAGIDGLHCSAVSSINTFSHGFPPQLCDLLTYKCKSEEMKTLHNNLNYRQLISMGARVALFGFVMSGPVAFVIVNLIKPQPAWDSSAVFAANYSIIQNLPYYFGFFLVAGMFMVAAGLFLIYQEGNNEVRFRLLLSVFEGI